MQLTLLYSAFNDLVQTPPEERSVRIEAELAKHIAYALPLPSQPMVNSSKFYIEQCSALVRSTIAAFNEEFPINTEGVMGLTSELWRLRYRLVHNCSMIDIDFLVAALAGPENAELNYTMPPRYKGLVSIPAPAAAKGAIRSFVLQKIPTHEVTDALS